jgi:hypothetical protein
MYFFCHVPEDDVIGKIVGEIEELGCSIPENFFQCQQEPGAHKVKPHFIYVVEYLVIT